MPGVIIHSIAHFDDILSAMDYAYGVDGVENLAISMPEYALKNADSYAFYIEDPDFWE